MIGTLQMSKKRRKKEAKDENKALEIAPDTFVFIPRIDVIPERNLATKVEKDKRKKSRKKQKQDLLKQLRKEGWI